MFEEIKQLEAELQKKKDVAIKDILKKREELDRQLDDLGYTKPVQKRKRRSKAEMEKGS